MAFAGALLTFAARTAAHLARTAVALFTPTHATHHANTVTASRALQLPMTICVSARRDMVANLAMKSSVLITVKMANVIIRTERALATRAFTVTHVRRNTARDAMIHGLAEIHAFHVTPSATKRQAVPSQVL